MLKYATVESQTTAEMKNIQCLQKKNVHYHTYTLDWDLDAPHVFWGVWNTKTIVCDHLQTRLQSRLAQRLPQIAILYANVKAFIFLCWTFFSPIFVRI